MGWGSNNNKKKKQRQKQQLMAFKERLNIKLLQIELDTIAKETLMQWFRDEKAADEGLRHTHPNLAT